MQTTVSILQPLIQESHNLAYGHTLYNKTIHVLAKNWKSKLSHKSSKKKMMRFQNYPRGTSSTGTVYTNT